jgi:hypothetical protein
MLKSNLSLLILCICLSIPFKLPAETPVVVPISNDWINPYLQTGQFETGVTTLTAALADNQAVDEKRFAIGALQFVRAVEKMLQSWQRYGWHGEGLNLMVPLFRIPVPHNPNPDTITYDKLRKTLETFVADLALSEATLSQIKSDTVKLPIKFGLIRLDLDNDGKATQAEALWQIFNHLNFGAHLTKQVVENFVINFDAADVYWLRGYVHLLSTIAELFLAYDKQALFDRAAHLIFSKPDTPYSFLIDSESEYWYDLIPDYVAFIHSVNFPVKDAKHLLSARDHLLTMSALSRQSWALIQKETDNELEWIPNPQQNSVIPNVTISKEMITGWLDFLSEWEALLAGEKLAPFWRGKDRSVGINLKKVLTQAQPFDLVLWIQGTAAAPYLEKGDHLTRPDFWRRLDQLFGGQFVGFAIWFN